MNENKFEIFNSAEFGSVRTLETNEGKVLFCGKDVANALGYKDTAYAISTHCKGVGEIPTPTAGGIQMMKFITEGDLYRLIAHSKLPTAERFEGWVFDEVLPTIRKTGSYNLPQMSEMEMINLISRNAIENEKRLKSLEIRQQTIEKQTERILDIFTAMSDTAWHENIIGQFKKICHDNNLNYRTTLSGLYKELEHEANCDLNARQRNKRKRMKSAGCTHKQTIRETSKIILIEDDDILKLAFENIFRKFQVRYLESEVIL